MAGLFTDFFNPFQRVGSNQYGMGGNSVTRGSLIAFNYPMSHAIKPNMIHDPYPLVIVTDIWPKAVRGVNLHYLTFPYIRSILQGNCGNASYSYYRVKPDAYIANAFRMYYRQGMSQIKKMDCDFLLTLLGAVRSWSPSEIETVRQQISQQIKQRIQMKASELAQAEKQLQFSKSQMGQINQKSSEMQSVIQGGANRNLIYPQQHQTGLAPANNPLPPSGPFGTENI